MRPIIRAATLSAIVERVPDLQVKGKAEPVAAYVLREI